MLFDPKNVVLIKGSGSGSGNADTATKLATARTISATGDASWSASFDGSANATAALALATTGIAAGTYRSVTVDVKGRVYGGSNPTTLAGYGITDAAPAVHTHTLAQISDALALIKNYASLNQGPVDADPDLTAEPVIITKHANTPGQDVFWHITTTFYSSRTSTSNRAQIAVQYNGGNQVWARSCYGIWTPWVRLDNAGMAPLASPALTGTPTAPTAAAGTSTTQLATTAFVQQATAPAPVVVTANTTVVLTGLCAVYACNTQAGSFTLTLPASPAAGTTVKVRDYKSTFAVNNLTVARNGKNILGLAEDYILDVSNHGREFVYIDATMGWSVQ